MKKRYILVFFALVLYMDAIAQKEPVEFSNYPKDWSIVYDPAISNDGKFATYVVRDSNHIRLVVKALDEGWACEYPGASQAEFSSDSRNILFSRSKDTIEIVRLGVTGGTPEYVTHVSSWRLVDNGRNEYLVYLTDSTTKDLIVRNLGGTIRAKLPAVDYYLCGNDGSILFFKQQTVNANERSEKVSFIRLDSGDASTIFRGRSAENIIIDQSGSGICFMGTDSGNIGRSAIWYYRSGMTKVLPLVGIYGIGGDSSEKIEALQGFTHDGSAIIFSTTKMENKEEKAKGNAHLDVWSYRDVVLQSQQLREVGATGGKATYALQVDQGRLVKLLGDNENWGSELSVPGNYVLIDYRPSTSYRNGEWNWNRGARTSRMLVSVKDGSRIHLSRVAENSAPTLSNDGKFVIFYDGSDRNYYSYCIRTGEYLNITKPVKGIWHELNDYPDSYTRAIGIAGFVEGTTWVVIFDQNDIFLVDMENKMPSVSLTNGMGRKMNLEFRFATGGQARNFYSGERILLKVFDRSSKKEGFGYLAIGIRPDLLLMPMRPYMYCGADEASEFFTFQPIKARDSNIYIVRRENSSESPNFYVTEDFVKFRPLSDVHPEKAYNWYTAELIQWRTFNGQFSQGILYKPEDFKPHLKYPVIFYYYEKFSNGLHGFIEPSMGQGPMSIPYFVSHGYLVFVPDIHYQLGNPGGSAFNSVVSAALHLRRLPYVDGRHFGLQGHSFGGYETQYIVTHTSLFAAACAASGWPDFIRAYGEIRDEDGTSRQDYYELRRERMGVSLWDRPDFYIASSPIFLAHKVTTPLLMVNNKKDVQAYFAGAEAMFTALRRLGKKAWMLQYDDADHVFLNGPARLDFNVRMSQFFDHYLKGAPAPKWMVEGIPASMKGIDNGLSLEPPGVDPGPNLLTPEEQKKVDALEHRKPITVTIP